MNLKQGNWNQVKVCESIPNHINKAREKQRGVMLHLTSWFKLWHVSQGSQALLNLRQQGDVLSKLGQQGYVLLGLCLVEAWSQKWRIHWERHLHDIDVSNCIQNAKYSPRNKSYVYQRAWRQQLPALSGDRRHPSECYNNTRQKMVQRIRIAMTYNSFKNSNFAVPATHRRRALSMTAIMLRKMTTEGNPTNEYPITRKKSMTAWEAKWDVRVPTAFLYWMIHEAKRRHAMW